MHAAHEPDDTTLSAWVDEARRTTRELVADLPEREWRLPYLATVLPTAFEVGHVAWFQEWHVLRDGGRRPSLLVGADRLYDSATIGHEERWTLDYPGRDRVDAYLDAVRARVQDALAAGPDADLRHRVQLTVFHEDMHAEALLWTRQALGDPAPRVTLPTDGARPATADSDELVGGDVEIPAGTLWLGAEPDQGFVFDNERWAHEVEVGAFRLDRRPVSETGFAAFVADGGYTRPELWGREGWRWCTAVGARRPVYWRPVGGGEHECRVFDRWRPLREDLPVTHVCWYEAEAWCRWAGRRLPTEAEWERAAAGTGRKRRHPWGDAPATPERALTDLRCLENPTLRGGAAGGSEQDVRHLEGHVWEWTASRFLPYPGFAPDVYREYSAPWFGARRVLRGGSHVTRARLLRNTHRNFFTPDRRDVWAGFRSCTGAERVSSAP